MNERRIQTESRMILWAAHARWFSLSKWIDSRHRTSLYRNTFILQLAKHTLTLTNTLSRLRMPYTDDYQPRARCEHFKTRVWLNTNTNRRNTTKIIQNKTKTTAPANNTCSIWCLCLKFSDRSINVLLIQVTFIVIFYLEVLEWT